MRDGSIDDIQPTIEFGTEGNSAVLMQSSVEAKVLGDRWTGEGEVQLDLYPRPAIRMYCMFAEGVTRNSAIRVESDPQRLKEVTVDGRMVKGFAARAKAVHDETSIWVKWIPGEDSVTGMGDDTTEVDRLLFSLFNFDIRGMPHWDQVAGQTIECHRLVSDEWTVRIRSLKSAQKALKDVRESGGHKMTHAGEAKRSDGKSFDGSEAKRLLEAVEHFLCLVAGLKFKLCCPVGINCHGERMWSRWSSPGRWDSGRLHWFDYRNPASVEGLFPGFMAKWRTEDWQEGLRESIYWYALSNDSTRGIDAGIIAAQTALERLSFEHCVVERKLVSEEGYKRLRASDLIRMVLSSLGIPLDIPSSAIEMLEEGKSNRWIDGPHGLVEIRNALVHGGRKRSNWSVECYIEAWKLAVWYVEMVILAVCGYQGSHWNRNNRQFEVVPWAS